MNEVDEIALDGLMKRLADNPQALADLDVRLAEAEASGTAIAATEAFAKVRAQIAVKYGV